jgi:DNA-directed RNA polymerase specialized sigma24 family protein
MRIGEWLDAVDSDDPAAWGILLDTTTRLARSWGAREPEDLASSFVLQQLERHARDARRADKGMSFDRWLGGCVRRHIRREGRKRRPHGLIHAGDVPAGPADAPPPRDAEEMRSELRRRLMCRLSRAEFEAMELHLAGYGSRSAAERLGIHRDSFRDRLQRATRKLAVTNDPRSWAADVAASFRREGDDVMLGILERYVGGAKLREIAAQTGLTYSSVRDRIARVRSKIRRVLGPAAAGPSHALPAHDDAADVATDVAA